MKNLSSHPAFEADLKAFLDGELPIVRRFQIRRHLKNCPQCREEIRIMQTIEPQLKEETAPLGADLRAKILENALLEKPGEKPVIALRSPYKMPRRLKRQLVLGAVAGVVAASIAAPNFSGSREYARRSSVQSDLKPIEVESANSALDSDSNNALQDSKAPIAGPVTITPPPPSGGGAGGANAAAGAAIRGAAETDSFRGVYQRGMAKQLREESNVVFSDGHVKNQLSSSFARASGDVRVNGGVTLRTRDVYRNLASDGNGIYLENRAVHKEGSVTVALDNAERGGDAVEQIVKNAGGFVASNSLSTGVGEVRSATLDCRVPVEKFEFVVQKIGALGTVRAKSLNGEDITARVAAAAARKTTLSREFSVASAQLRRKEQTAKKRDAQSLYYARLEVRQLRLQAAQSRAALENLRRFSSLSSLYVTVQDKMKPAPVAGTTGDFGQTARAAWSSFLISARLPVQLLIWILAYAPLWLPALLIWKKWGRKWLAAA